MFWSTDPKETLPRFQVLALVLAVALAGAGCDGDDDHRPSPTPTSLPTAVPATSSPTMAPTIPPTPSPTTPPTPSPVAPLEAPPEIVQHAADWPLPNRNYGSDRAALDAEIRAANVLDLTVAWRAPIRESGVFGNLATNPLILGDTVYVQALSGAVYALDFGTGAIRWQQSLGGLTPGPNGVAVGYDRVYAATGDGRVVALDIADGEVLWSNAVTRTATEGIDIQPVVADGKVYVSTVPVSVSGQFKAGDRGVIHALDAETGAVLWSFDTVESEDLWGHPEINSGGGAWYPPAVDLQRGAIYWGIGNAAPFPGVEGFPNGSSRPGPNLYMTSTVALDARTGDLLWYHQVKPHDLFDHDFQLTMALSLPIGGGARDAVIGTGKTGTVHAFDPDDGSELWRVAVGEHSNDDLDELPLGEEVIVSPGLFGGVLTPPAMADGVLYVAVLHMPSPYEADRTNPFGFGGLLETATGEITAIDGSDGSILWTRDLPSAAFGGATVVNDLLFTSTFDGTIYALRRSDGEILWTDATGKLINGWPAVARDTIVFPIGGGAPGEVVAYRLPES